MTNNKESFLTWTKNLFFVQCADLVGYVIALLPFMGAWFGWVNTIIAIGTVVCLFKLMPVSTRYRKAAIFSGIAVVLLAFVRIAELGIVLIIVVSVCQWIALYQEFCGHSEMLNGIDEKLSRKWHSLFNWNIFGGILVGVLASPIVVVLAMMKLDVNMLTMLMTSGFEVIIRVVYLLYLKRTREVYENFEPQVEVEIPEGEI